MTPRSQRKVIALSLGVVIGGTAAVYPLGSPADAPSQQVLYGVSAVSASDGWAVGEDGRRTLALRWDGRAWVRVSTPSPSVNSGFLASDFLTSVSRASPSDAWAVGPHLILRWDGTSWTAADAPVGSAYLEGVSAPSDTAAWAVGHDEPGRRAIILHWDGRSWTPMRTPDPGGRSTLAGVSARAPDDVWAVGSRGGKGGGYEGAKTLAMHWDGSSWTLSKVPSQAPGAVLSAVSANSPRDVWAVGSTGGRSTSQPLIMHWNGASWKTVKTPRVAASESQLTGVSVRSRKDAWAVGSDYPRTLTMHWNGHAWKTVGSPSPGGPGTGALLSAVSVGASGDAWAVGDYGTRAGGAKTLILGRTGRSWTVR